MEETQGFDFGAAVAQLAEQRQRVIGAREQKAALLAKLYAGDEWDRAHDIESVAGPLVAALEAELRKAASAYWLASADKHPHEAVNVRVLTVLEYGEPQALTYAREHLPQALKLDRREFEKVAKVLKLDFVATREEPQPTIATDLSRWLTLEG